MNKNKFMESYIENLQRITLKNFAETSDKDRYFALLFLTSAILLRFHRLFAFWSVFRPSRCGRYAFSRRVSLDELGIPLGLCMFSVRLHSSHFSFFRT